MPKTITTKKKISYKKTIGERIAIIRDYAGQLADDLLEYEPEADCEFAEDYAGDAETAQSAMEILSELPDPPAHIAKIVVDYRPTPEHWDDLEHAKDIKDEMELIIKAIDEAGLGDDKGDFMKAIEEASQWLCDF